MACIMATMFSLLVGLHLIQTPCTAQTRYSMIPLQLPNPVTEPSRYCYEKWTWYYTIVWMGLFGFIVVSQYYEYFTAEGYLYFCGTLAVRAPIACRSRLVSYFSSNLTRRCPVATDGSTYALSTSLQSCREWKEVNQSRYDAPITSALFDKGNTLPDDLQFHWQLLVYTLLLLSFEGQVHHACTSIE